MSYKLNVYNDIRTIKGLTEWDRLIYRIRREYNCEVSDIMIHLNEILAGYNGVNLPETPFISFETEEDAVAFKLKWLI